DQYASRKWKIQEWPSSLVSQCVAMPGWGWAFSSSVVRPTNMLPRMLFSQVPDAFCGSSESGSPWLAMSIERLAASKPTTLALAQEAASPLAPKLANRPRRETVIDFDPFAQRLCGRADFRGSRH